MTDSNVSLFGGANSLISSDLFKQLQGTTDNLAGGDGFSGRRISIRGGKFRQIVHGEQMNVSKDDTMNFIIIDAAPVSRTFYEGVYDPENPTPPACWSADTNKGVPCVEVEEAQANRCADCPQNVKGSGQGQSRACRYNQRMAVAVEGDLENVYQFQLAATSIFGDTKENAMPMQGYARLLKAHKTPAIAVLTEMRFDEDADVPKLFFKPVRPLTEEELEEVVKLREHPEVKQALTLTVSQTDGVAPAITHDPDVPEKGDSLFGGAEEPEEEDAPVAAPKKAVKKKAAPKPKTADKITELVGEWDDDE